MPLVLVLIYLHYDAGSSTDSTFLRSMRPLGNINSPGDIEYTDISQLPELSDPDGRGASKQPPQYTYQLSNQAIKAILAEDNWHHHVWDPMSNKPDINKWNKDMETLCEKYGIPDTQRAQCAVASTKRELRTELQCVLQHARAESGPVCWDQFKKFMVEFTGEGYSIVTNYRTSG